MFSHASMVPAKHRTLKKVCFPSHALWRLYRIKFLLTIPHSRFPGHSLSTSCSSQSTFAYRWSNGHTILWPQGTPEHNAHISFYKLSIGGPTCRLMQFRHAPFVPKPRFPKPYQPGNSCPCPYHRDPGHTLLSTSSPISWSPKATPPFLVL